MKNKKQLIGILLLILGIALFITALIFAFKINMKYTPYFMMASIIINTAAVCIIRGEKNAK